MEVLDRDCTLEDVPRLRDIAPVKVSFNIVVAHDVVLQTHNKHEDEIQSCNTECRIPVVQIVREERKQ